MFSLHEEPCSFHLIILVSGLDTLAVEEDAEQVDDRDEEKTLLTTLICACSIFSPSSQKQHLLTVKGFRL